MRRVLRRATQALAAVVAGLMIGGCSQLTFVRGVEEPTAVPVEREPERAPWVAPAAVAVERSDDAGTTRLRQLADVWTAARWFHPDAIERIGAWDTAYLRHLESARAATDDASYARAVQNMLGELRDAETRVIGDTMVVQRIAGAAAALARTGDSLIIARPIHASLENLSTLREQLRPALTTTAPRSAAVLDLRVDSGRVSGAAWWSRQLLDEEYPLPGAVLQAPARRRVRHAHPGGDTAFGALPVRRPVERDCCTQWVMTSGAVLRVSGVGPDALREQPITDIALVRPVAPMRDGYAPPAIVVLVNDATVVPAPLFALHDAGDAVFVSTGSGVLRSDAHAMHLPIGGGFHARIRVEAMQLASGKPIPTSADTVLAADGASLSLIPDSTDRAVQLALAIARGSVRVGARAIASSLRAGVTDDASRLDAPYPSLPERLLAVTKLWGLVRAFNPYLPMADESWDDMFERTLGDVEEAANARDYSAAMLRYVATLDASQVEIRVQDHPEFGAQTGYVPFRLRLVDRRPLVMAINDSLTQRTGVRVGDEILAIGGEPVDKRLGRLRELVPASNEWSRDQRLEAWLEAGPAGAISTFRVRAANGTITDREFAYLAAPDANRGATPARRDVEPMANGVVRVRLGADTARTVVPLPSLVADARAVVVDARGIRDSASLRWLAGSILDADRRAYARDDRSAITAPPRGALRTPELDPARQFTRSERTTPPAPREAFTGPVAILIDATTSGDGELIALRLLAGGTNRVLVGSQTAGAVGETAVASLPGGVLVRFPVSDVRYPDGRFIQRLGLAPNVVATPSVDGVRNGRDEIMEAALRWITQQLAPPAVRRR